jgi:hypothetical protein
MTIETSRRPVALQGTVTATVWCSPPDGVGESRSLDDDHFTRIRAADLRDAMKKTARTRADLAGQRAVLIDIDVLVDDDASEAFRQYAEINARAPGILATTLHYVGTPAGLAGLISDIRSLNIADGVVLVPVQLRPSPDAAGYSCVVSLRQIHSARTGIVASLDTTSVGPRPLDGAVWLYCGHTSAGAVEVLVRYMNGQWESGNVDEPHLWESGWRVEDWPGTYTACNDVAASLQGNVR